MNEEGGSSGELYRAKFCRAFFFIAWTFWLTKAFWRYIPSLLFFPACSVSDGMGWIKALDGWVDWIELKIPVQGVEGAPVAFLPACLFVCFRSSRMMLLVATARCYG